MHESPLPYALCPGDLDPDDPVTVVWRIRTLPIPNPPPGPVAAPRPFPFEPVIGLCIDGQLAWGRTTTNWVDQRWQGVITNTASVLAVNRHRVYRWIKSGLIVDQADVIAIMFGLHPCPIWPDWFEHAPSE